VDTQLNYALPQERKARSNATLKDIARRELQKMIPSKREVSDLASSAFEWLNFLDTLSPQPLGIKSKKEMLGTYEDMHSPEVDALKLASWLVALAVTGQQRPQECGTPQVDLVKYHRKWLEFSRAVSDKIESLIIHHDSLLGTIEGIGIGLHFVRL
jgi:hypothetical protein